MIRELKRSILSFLLLLTTTCLYAQDLPDIGLNKEGYFYSVEERDSLLSQWADSLGLPFALDQKMADTLHQTGYQLRTDFQMETGREVLRLAHDLYHSLEDHRKTGSSLHSLGYSFYQKSNHEEALILYDHALWRYQKGDAKDLIGKLLMDRGNIYNARFEPGQALEWYQQALKYLKSSGTEGNLARCNANMGRAYYLLGNTKKAIQECRKSIDIFIKLGLKTDEARGYENLGVYYRALSKHEESLENFHKAIRIFSAGNFPVSTARNLYNIAEIHAEKVRMDTAISYYEQALELFTKKGHVVGMATCQRGMGIVHKNKGEYLLALDRYDEALDGFESVDHQVYAAITRLSKGIIYSELARYEESLTFYEGARDVFEQFGMENELALCDLNMGTVYYERSQFEQALFHYTQSLEAFSRTGQKEYEADTRVNLGSVYARQSRLIEALSQFQQAQDTYKEIKFRGGVADSYLNMGSIYAEMKDFESGLSSLTLALKFFRREGLTLDVARTHLQMGLAFQETGQYDESLASYQKAFALHQSLDFNGRNRYICLQNIGSLYATQSRFEEARQSYEQALYGFGELGLDQDKMELFAALAQLSLAQGRYPEALRFADSCATLADKNLTESLHEGSRLTTARKASLAYEVGVSASFALGTPEKSFRYAEQNKGRNLSLVLAEAGIRNLPLPDSFANEEYLLASTLSFIGNQLQEEQDSLKRARLLLDRTNTLEKLQLLKARIRRGAPAYANLKYPEPVSVEQVQEILGQEEVLLEYFWGDKEVFAFLISRDESRMIRIDSLEALTAAIAAFQSYASMAEEVAGGRVALQTKAARSFHTSASSIYRLAFAPAELTGMLKGKKLLIVPDGGLHSIPFEALIKDPQIKPYGEYHYLLQTYSLSYIPSATYLSYRRAHPQTLTGTQMLCVADPDFSKTQEEVRGGSLGNYSAPWEFGRLANTRSEADSIARLYGRGRTTLLLGQAATEDSLKGLDLRPFRYLHFATHGVVDTLNPQYSLIALASPADSNSREDGLLHLYEMFSLEMQADLVVLSACNTGRGRYSKGEGLIGFTQALLMGTPTLILSLWEVNDKSTSRLFAGYYRRLFTKEGQNKYSALRDTQLEMVKTGGKYANPYYWGPFILIGEQ